MQEGKGGLEFQSETESVDAVALRKGQMRLGVMNEYQKPLGGIQETLEREMNDSQGGPNANREKANSIMYCEGGGEKLEPWRKG